MTKIVPSEPLKTWITGHKNTNNRIDVTNLNRYIDANTVDGTITVTPPPPPPPPPVSGLVPLGMPGTFQLVFHDEFDAPLDPAVWNKNWLGAPGTITKPINSAEICAYDPARVAVANGCLELSCIASPVKAADGKTYQYRSGMIESAAGGSKAGKEFVFGAFEARIYWPGPGPVPYNWGAFWLNGHHGKWPDHMELDIIENAMGWHYHAPNGSGGDLNAGYDPEIDYSGWHVYGANWQKDRIDFYYDGAPAHSQTENILAFPNYIVLNYGMSSQHGGPVMAGQTMKVDYVRVYKPI